MDNVQLRSLRTEDLDRVAGIEGRIAGHPRRGFLEKRFDAAFAAPDAFITCAASRDGELVGYAIARVQEGEFGAVDRAAVLDTIGVHPGFAGSGIGHALLSQLFLNLATLQVETVLTQVSPANIDLQRFLYSCGFHPSQRLVLSKTDS